MGQVLEKKRGMKGRMIFQGRALLASVQGVKDDEEE